MSTENSTATLDQLRQQKAEVESKTTEIKSSLTTYYNNLLEEALKVGDSFKAEFGEKIPSPFVVSRPTASTDGRVLGGLKRALATAQKKNDSARVQELTERIAAATIPQVTEPVS